MGLAIKKKKIRKINTNERGEKKRVEHQRYLMLIAVAKDCL